MRVGLVTYHKSTSYGACLQAYATQYVLGSLGHNVVVIDYLNRHEQRIKKTFFSSDGSFKSFISNAIKSIVYHRSACLRRAFSDFGNEYNLTTKTFYSATEMNELVFDVLAVGSDQVWNPKISGGLDPVFLLDFGKASKRISISSSFGSHILSESEMVFFAEKIKHFSSISVREQFAKQQLEHLGFSNVKVLSDPTLMVGKDVWEQFLQPTSEKGYVLTYFVSNSFSAFRDDINKINKGGLKIFNVQSSDYHWDGVDKTIVGINPHEFVGLIKGASLVITDSFHGTVFSIVFHKQTVVINNSSNPIRIRELLKTLSIEDIEYNVSKQVITLSESQFESIDKQIAKIRDDSIEWIKQSLSW